MQVLHIDTGKELRGGQRQILLLARGLREQGHEQLVACPEESALGARALEQGLRVFALPPHDPGHAHCAVQLRQVLLAKRFDVLHAHDGQGQTIAWLSSLGMPLVRVASRRVTFLPGRFGGGRLIHRLKYKFTCDAVIAVSNFVKGILVESGVPGAMIEVIPDGIELPLGPPEPHARSRARARWGFSEEDFLLGHIGAYTKEKGQDVAIAALRTLERCLPRARLLLAGEPVGSSPGTLPGTPGLEGRVRALGPGDSPADFFAALDLYLMPSRTEGLGSSALLAMAHGLAVVASRVGGLPEVVVPGETGWLVPSESPEALAEAITDAASDRARLCEFGQRGRERARRFSAEVLVDRTEALYARLAGAAGR